MVDTDIQYNIKLHNKIYKKYASRHTEIYNKIEQDRIRKGICDAAKYIDISHGDLLGLDVGCGAGNLTKHMLSANMRVTSADVSKSFLSMIEHEYKGCNVNTLQLNGSNLDNIPSNKYNFVAIYSVLHHIPEYLDIVKEMARVCAVGGVIYIDHERTDEYWNGGQAYDEFLKKQNRIMFKKYFELSGYITKFRRMFDKKYSYEGDIHVWPDDHIEWNKIDEILSSNRVKRLHNYDYLLFRGGYKESIYREYYSKCSDMRCRVYKKIL